MSNAGDEHEGRVVAFARARVTALAELGAVGLAAVTLISFFAQWSLVSDLLANFRHIFAVLAIGPAVVLGAQRRYTLLSVAVVTLVINLGFIAGSLPYRGDTCEPTLVVATINALGPDNDVDATLLMLAAQQVDIVVVTELGGDLDRALTSRYRYAFSFPSEGTAGMGLFSRYPISKTQKLPGEWFPQLSAEVTADSRSFRILGIHPPPPFRPSSAQLRNRELSRVADLVAASEGPFILAGDFNASRQSSHFSPLLDAGLVDSRIGRGVHGTWPAPLPLRVAIDHVLGSPDFEVCSFSTAPASGSDHLPVIVGFRW